LRGGGPAAHPRPRGDHGRSHLAACTNRIGIITALIEGGADLGALDSNGRTPLSYAESHLRLLRGAPAHDVAPLYRERVAEIVRMLRAFLVRVGQADAATDVAALGARLQASSTVVRGLAHGAASGRDRRR
jgi:hypothetical protein